MCLIVDGDESDMASVSMVQFGFDGTVWYVRGSRSVCFRLVNIAHSIRSGHPRELFERRRKARQGRSFAPYWSLDALPQKALTDSGILIAVTGRNSIVRLASSVRRFFFVIPFTSYSTQPRKAVPHCSKPPSLNRTDHKNTAPAPPQR
jgi:hypothetical protein